MSNAQTIKIVLKSGRKIRVEGEPDDFQKILKALTSGNPFVFFSKNYIVLSSEIAFVQLVKSEAEDKQ